MFVLIILLNNPKDENKTFYIAYSIKQQEYEQKPLSAGYFLQIKAFNACVRVGVGVRGGPCLSSIQAAGSLR